MQQETYSHTHTHSLSLSLCHTHTHTHEWCADLGTGPEEATSRPDALASTRGVVFFSESGVHRALPPGEPGPPKGAARAGDPAQEEITSCEVNRCKLLNSTQGPPPLGPNPSCAPLLIE